jgi:hypothetical protein
MLPSSETPLYHHSLPDLEQWLQMSGFQRTEADPCSWNLKRPQWTAVLTLQTDGLSVCWNAAGRSTSRSFSYGLSRADMEAALLAGP